MTKSASDARIYSHKEFEELCSVTFALTQKLASVKGGEYSGDEDRLANFRRNAENLGLDYRQIWAVYAAKHWDAIMQYVKDIASSTDRPRMETLSGRADDLILYLILFKAMLIETERPLLNPAQKLAEMTDRRA